MASDLLCCTYEREPHPDTKDNCGQTLYEEQPLPALQAACPIRQQQGGCNGPTYDLRMGISTPETHWQRICNPCRKQQCMWKIHNPEDRRHVHRAKITLLLSMVGPVWPNTEPVLACASQTVMWAGAAGACLRKGLRCADEAPGSRQVRPAGIEARQVRPHRGKCPRLEHPCPPVTHFI